MVEDFLSPDWTYKSHKSHKSYLILWRVNKLIRVQQRPTVERQRLLCEEALSGCHLFGRRLTAKSQEQGSPNLSRSVIRTLFLQPLRKEIRLLDDEFVVH